MSCKHIKNTNRKKNRQADVSNIEDASNILQLNMCSKNIIDRKINFIIDFKGDGLESDINAHMTWSGNNWRHV